MPGWPRLCTGVTTGHILIRVAENCYAAPQANMLTRAILLSALCLPSHKELYSCNLIVMQRKAQTNKEMKNRDEKKG